ncbi:MAG: hypothetical protein L0Z53_21590, partial [Acidobacteriales bacterium]|nr:hypothetical protein [Terriglobales bacterium]
MRERITLLGKLMAGFAAAILFIGFGIGSSLSMPANAHILLDYQSREYLAPACVTDMSRYELSTAAEA